MKHRLIYILVPVVIKFGKKRDEGFQFLKSFNSRFRKIRRKNSFACHGALIIQEHNRIRFYIPIASKTAFIIDCSSSVGFD